MAERSTDTFTFLFTDIEGSTRLWEQHPDVMRPALSLHDSLVRAAVEAHGGTVFKTMGDAFFAAFSSPAQALAAALDAQRTLLAEPWTEDATLRVRMALHTGVVELRAEDYFGAPLNRLARLMAAGHGGQVLVSQTTADLLRSALPEGATLRDLGSHRLKGLDVPEHVYQLFHPQLPAEFPVIRSLEAFAHNLPRLLTRFIGREQEMAVVTQLLTRAALLTLTGVGGCGKTRLALQVAADQVDEFHDGVWLVELAPVTDPTLIPQTVASILGLQEEPGRPLTTTLADYLRSRRLLLLLDNCEHLLTASAQFAVHMLGACPQLQILATSREALGIPGEQTYPVPSLSVPNVQQPHSFETMAKTDAVRLFADRAALSQPTFALTAANAVAVVQVCQRLDGIPLALELAAARVKTIPVEKIAERLDDRFRLLTGGSRIALPRQRTLQALIDWSYDLLTDAERTLLQRLSVFAGGWTLEAAEAVCSADPLDEWQVLELLTRLVEKSLVVYDEQESGARYRLLETVGQYARDRLLESGESQAGRDRHREYYIQFGEAARAAGSNEAPLLSGEYDNLRAALEWCLAAEPGQPAELRLAAALGWFWWRSGMWTEGQSYLKRFLSRADNEQPEERSVLLDQAGRFALWQGECAEARSHYEASLAICRQLGDQRRIAGALWGLASVQGYTGNYQESQSLLEESLALYQSLGDRTGAAIALHNLGATSHIQGNLAAAEQFLQRSLQHWAELGEPGGAALSRLNLADLANDREEFALAASLCEQSLATFRELNEPPRVAAALTLLGEIRYHRGDTAGAYSCLQEGGRLLQQFRDKRAVFRLLSGLAMLDCAWSQPERAACLLGALETLIATVRASMPPKQHANRAQSETSVRASLGEEAFAAARAQGQAMTLEQAIRYALDEHGH